MKKNSPPATGEDMPTDMMGALRKLLEREIKRVGSKRYLAQLMGIGESTLSHIMAGREPRTETIKAIAEYFCVPVPQLLSAETITEIKPIPERIFITLDELRRLLETEFSANR